MEQLSNSVNMSFRVDKTIKKQADELFKRLGLNTSVALNMFLTQSIREQGLPFTPSMVVPQNHFWQALKEVEKIENGIRKAKRYKKFEEALEDIEE